MNHMAESERDTAARADAGPPMGELLQLALDQAAPVVGAIPDELLKAPTPCTEYDVRTLVNHLFHVLVQFQKLAGKQDSEFGTPPDYVGEGDDWRERFVTEARDLVAAWSAPGAEAGTTGRMNMPARTVGSMALLDLTVHVWDLARATGQDFRADARAVDVLSVVADMVQEMAPTARKMGMFADPVALPDDGGDDGGPSSGLDRLLAATGRNPDWTPPGGPLG
jgi:uncharacterized protein (TIGR03086 family)